MLKLELSMDDVTRALMQWVTDEKGIRVKRAALDVEASKDGNDETTVRFFLRITEMD